MVSRRDLLSSFLRPDREIREEIRLEVIRRFRIPTSDVRCDVAEGVVTLAGRLPADIGRQSVLDRIEQRPGVVGISDHLMT